MSSFYTQVVYDNIVSLQACRCLLLVEEEGSENIPKGLNGRGEPERSFCTLEHAPFEPGC